MDFNELCISYLHALNEGSLEKVFNLFTEDAVIFSPLYGKMDVKAFYEKVFSDTNSSSTQLLNVFLSATETESLALHFTYQWEMKNGGKKTFECVDVFNLNKTKDKFTKLTIIYDSYSVRDIFNQNIVREG